MTELPPLPPAEMSRVQDRTLLRRPDPQVLRVETDVASGLVTFVHEEDSGLVRIDRDGWTFGGKDHAPLPDPSRRSDFGADRVQQLR